MGTPNERTIVDEGAVSPERLGKVVPLRVAAQPPPPLEQLVEQTFRIAIGMTALASEVLAEAVARTLGREPFAEGEAPGDETARPASGVPLVAGAAIGVALEGAKWGARAATTMVRSAELFFSLVTSPGFVQEPLRQAGDSARGRSTRAGASNARATRRRRRRSCGCSSPRSWTRRSTRSTSTSSSPNASNSTASSMASTWTG